MSYHRTTLFVFVLAAVISCGNDDEAIVAACMEENIAETFDSCTRARTEADCLAACGSWHPSGLLPPLQFATTPEHPLRRFFSDAVIDGFLDRLVADQQDDGGWPIDWPAPGTTATNEWRAIRTLEALQILSAYGRV